MSSRSLHKSLRDRVRRELRSSPMLWKEYLRRRWAARKRWWLNVPFELMKFPGAIVGPIVLGSFVALPVLVELDPPSAGRVVTTSESLSLWSLVALSACLAGGCALIASGFSEQVFRSRDLTVLVHFPIGDRGFLNRQLALVVGGSFVGTLTIAIVLGAIVNLQGLLFATWPVVVLFSLIDWLVMAATVVLISAHIRWRIHNEFVGLGGLFFAIFSAILCGGIAQVTTISRTVACIVFALSPPGWMHAAFYFGAIEGMASGWLFLLPAALVVALAGRWLMGTFSIRDVMFFDGEATIAAIEGTARMAMPRFWNDRRRAIAAAGRHRSDAREADETTASTAFRNAEFLRPVDLARLGWVERFVAARLTERQRLLLEYDNPGKPYWTRFAMASAVIAVAAVLADHLPSTEQDRAAGKFLVGLLNALALAVGIFSFPRDGPGQRAWHAYFPVGFRELSRAYFILALCRIVLAAPIVLVLNVAGAVLEGHSARAAVVGVAACCPVAFGWYLFGRCLAASGSTNDTANRSVFVCWFMVITLLGALSFIALAPFGVVRPVSGGAALLLAWAMWRRYAWMLDHGNIDIVG